MQFLELEKGMKDRLLGDLQALVEIQREEGIINVLTKALSGVPFLMGKKGPKFDMK